MFIQFIRDKKGNTTGVFIPIDDWQSLKEKYTDLEKEELKQDRELSNWQKKLIDERLNAYQNNTRDLSDFDETLNELE
jgi:hypothetical protein